MPLEKYWDLKGNKIHLDIYKNSNVKEKDILFHGIETNGRQMTIITGHPLTEDEFEAITIDMPIYDKTIINKDPHITFSDWFEYDSNYVDYELKMYSRPISPYSFTCKGIETNL